MKRQIFILFFILQIMFVNAQNLSVESFRLLETDLTANTQGTMMIDQNGEVAALIKVVTTATGFVFDGGMMGIVNTVPKTGEVWVYVPRGIQRITISHQQFGVLRDYYFPISIDNARTYEMVLKHPDSNTAKMKAQFVIFNVTPHNAIVFIDNEARSLNSEGQLSIRLSQGEHSYTITAPSYRSESGTVVVGDDRVSKVINLESLEARLNVYTDGDAEVYINDEYKGTGKWSGLLEAGEYLVEIRREGYKNVYSEIQLKEQDFRNVSLKTSTLAYGSVEIISDPLGCDIYIDGEKKGATPDFYENLRAGNHSLTLIRGGYKDVERIFTVFDDSITHLMISDFEKRQESEKERAEREAREQAEIKAAEKARKEREAQEQYEREVADVVEIADKMPSFPGGNAACVNYLVDNIYYPTYCKNHGISGKVTVAFVVEKNGKITHPKIVSGVHEELDNEAIRVISSMPRWEPGTNEGVPVRVWQSLVISFR